MWHVRVRREMHTGFGGETEGKSSLGNPGHRWGVNIKQILRKCDGRTWIGLL